MIALTVRRPTLIVLLATLVLFAVSVGLSSAHAESRATPSFFASQEFRLTSLERFGKWVAALDRYAREKEAAAERACDDADRLACAYLEWHTFLDGLRDLDRWEQLAEVNRYMNARPYRADDRNWGMSDHWSTPGEFLTRSGDCEDYAIAKYLSLKWLGWSDDALRVVAVKDQNLGMGHAVLIVSLDGKTWLLDNQIEDVTDTRAVGHYRPVYSLNATAWWLHRDGGRA